METGGKQLFPLNPPQVLHHPVTGSPMETAQAALRGQVPREGFPVGITEPVLDRSGKRGLAKGSITPEQPPGRQRSRETPTLIKSVS